MCVGGMSVIFRSLGWIGIRLMVFLHSAVGGPVSLNRGGHLERGMGTLVVRFPVIVFLLFLYMFFIMNFNRFSIVFLSDKTIIV